MRKPIATLVAALGLLLASSALYAQAQGRAYGTIKDDQGQPLEGVKITLTDPSAKDYRVEVKSDKKGNYSLVVLDATRTLIWRIEKEGFQTLESPRKIPAGMTTKIELVLYPAGTVAGDLSAAAVSAKNKEELEQARKLAEGKAGAVEAFNAAVPLFNAGDLDGALAKLQEAITSDPALNPAHYVIGRVYERKGMFADALAASEKALELDPNDARSMLLRFQVASRLGDAAKAKEALEALKAKDPVTTSKILLQQGMESFNANRSAEARAALEDAVAIDPNNGKAYYHLGLCYASLNEIAKARAAFEKFVTLLPDDPEAPMAKDMIKALK